MNIHDYADSEMLALDVANVIAGDLEGALLTHEDATLMVPGGSTPGPVFDALCAADLDWGRVTVLLTDERWVPEDHPQSNAALIRKRLLTSRAAAAQFHSYYRADQSPEAACAAQSPELARRRPVSVLVLGMGADMHTASLFPGAKGLEAALAPDAPMLLPITVPGHEIPRVTVCASALQGALSKHLLIIGTQKRDALESARHLTPQEAPIAAVLDALTVHWSAT